MLPEKPFLKRGEVREAYGLSDWMMRRLVGEGVLRAVRLGARARKERALFRRTEVVRKLGEC
jgi:hypothetical protein